MRNLLWDDSVKPRRMVIYTGKKGFAAFKAECTKLGIEITQNRKVSLEERNKIEEEIISTLAEGTYKIQL